MGQNRRGAAFAGHSWQAAKTSGLPVFEQRRFMWRETWCAMHLTFEDTVLPRGHGYPLDHLEEVLGTGRRLSQKVGTLIRSSLLAA